MLQNHALAGDPFKMQDRSMDFNVRECKMFMDMASNFTVQLTIKKLSPLSSGVMSQKNIHYYDKY